MAFHSPRAMAQRAYHAANRGVRAASNITAAMTPGYQKYVHPVLDSMPETRPYARAINTVMAVNSTGRNLATVYDRIRGAM